MAYGVVIFLNGNTFSEVFLGLRCDIKIETLNCSLTEGNSWALKEPPAVPVVVPSLFMVGFLQG